MELLELILYEPLALLGLVLREGGKGRGGGLALDPMWWAAEPEVFTLMCSARSSQFCLAAVKSSSFSCSGFMAALSSL